jgi:hypothetical protein
MPSIGFRKSLRVHILIGADMRRIVFLNAYDLLTFVSQCPRWRLMTLYRDFVQREPVSYVAARPQEREAAEEVVQLFPGAQIEDPRTLQARGRINAADELALLTTDPDLGLKLVVLRKVQTETNPKHV